MTIQELNEKLNAFDWGYKVGDVNLALTDDWFDRYRTISPAKMWKDECGVCWDYAALESHYFLQHSFVCTLGDLRDNTFSLYYIESDDKPEIPTHTWLAYMQNGNVYLFESSWKSYRGITPCADEATMIRNYSALFCADGSYRNFVTYKYKPFTSFGMMPEDFMLIIKQTGTKLLEGTVNGDQAIYRFEKRR